MNRELMSPCRLCPRGCGARRLEGETGYCGAGAAITAARAALYFWEEPCISGTRGSGAVFFSRCSLGCVFCQNEEISRRPSRVFQDTRAKSKRISAGRLSQVALDNREKSEEISVERLSRIFLDLQGQGAHNINLVTAAHYLPLVCEALELAKAAGLTAAVSEEAKSAGLTAHVAEGTKAAGLTAPVAEEAKSASLTAPVAEEAKSASLTIPVVYNSGGYESVSALQAAKGSFDVFLPDLKYLSPDLAASLSAAPDYPDAAVAAIDEMLRQAGSPVFDGDGIMQKGVIIRHLVLPGHTKEALRILRFIADRWGDEVYVSLLNQYTPMPGIEERSPDPGLRRRLTRREYDKVVDEALRLGLSNVFIQEENASGAEFIPPFTGV